MNFWRYIFLFLLGFGVAYSVAAYQNSPGYMDADYYFAGGLRLAEGEGFTELTLWNYLDDPDGLPHPSHAYWMPVGSIVSMIGIKVFPSLPEFEAAQIIFILIAGLIPPLTAALAYSLTNRSSDAIFAGLLATSSGFYLPFLPTSDTFGLYMLMGGAFFLLVKWVRAGGAVLKYLILGALVGLMHLTRADGVIWLVIAWIGVGSFNAVKENGAGHGRLLKSWMNIWNSEQVTNSFLILLGYLIIMSPWFIRNIMVFGVPLSPGGVGSLWLTEYNELFVYPASTINVMYWWQSGLGAIVQARAISLSQNLQTFMAVQGSVFLLPLMLIGVWKFRHNHQVKLAAGSWLFTLLIMTLLFPFSGARGGFFHSGAAVQPLLWALVPVGLNQFVSLGVRKRSWVASQATTFFQIGLVLFAIGLSSLIFHQKFLGRELRGDVWDMTAVKYTRLDEILVEFGALPEDIVLSINPPGYLLATDRAAIAIPNGGLETMLAVALRYQADYLILETDSPLGLQPLYDEPENHYGLVYLGNYDNTKLFEIDINGQ